MKKTAATLGLVLSSFFLQAQDVSFYQYIGNKKLGEGIELPGEKDKNPDPSFWKQMPVKSGDTVEVRRRETYLIEWAGLRGMYASHLSYEPTSNIDYEPLNDYEFQRYDSGDKRGVIYSEIKRVNPDMSLFRTVKLGTRRSGEDLGKLVLKEVK